MSSVCAMQCKGRIATYKKITSICNGWIEIAWLFNILCTTLVRILLHYLLCYYEFFWRFLCNLIGMSRSLWFERGSSFSFQNSKMNMGFVLFLISFFLFHCHMFPTSWVATSLFNFFKIYLVFSLFPFLLQFVIKVSWCVSKFHEIWWD